MNNCDCVATVIRQRIKDEGLSCYALGKATGVAPAVIQKFMSGKSDIGLATASKLCKVLGLVLVLE